MAPRKKRKSQKGWHRMGTYTRKTSAEKKSKDLKKHNKKTKITQRIQKVRKTPSGRRVIHPADYPGGKKTKVYRVYAK